MKKLTYSTYIEKGCGYVADKKNNWKSVVLHSHDFFEVEFILGCKKTTHILNGKKRSMEKGSVYIINPSDVHCYEIEEGGHFDRYNVRFKQDMVNENILASVLNSHCKCVLKGDDFSTAKKLFDIIEYFYSHGADESSTPGEISSRLIESLILLIRDRSEYESGDETNPRSQIQKILLYLHKNFKDNITLEEIANYSAFSPHYVSQLFHTETSYTITQYITNLRLEYAKNLLFSTDHSIAEICTQCGFHSFAHFLRCFKKLYGISPSKFRQKLREENKQ